ncbi:MAG: APC family permease [Nannocystaceae bacterium]
MPAPAHARLRLFDLTMIVVSLVIGMGIFRTPVNAARGAEEAWIFFAAWIAGGLVALCGALTHAEIGSRYPVTGGYYRVFAHVYHPSIAFAITSIIVVSNAASAAAVSLIGAEYLGKVLFPGVADPRPVRVAVAAVTLVAFFGLNLLGLRASARAQNVLTIIKIGLIVTLVAALVLAEPAAAPLAAAPDAAPLGPEGAIRAFGLALIATSFTYGGYQQVINFGGEVESPIRTIPRGVFFGIVVVIALYLLLNLTYVRVIGFEALKSAESIAALLAAALFGPAGFTLLSLLLFLSVLGYVNVALLNNPRLLRAMSDDRLLPSILGRPHATTGALVGALVVFTVLCLGALFYAQTFDAILNYTMVLESIGMASSAATLFFLRPRTAHLEDQGIYKMRLYPLLPLIFIVAYLFIAGSIAVADPRAAVGGLAVFAAFLGVYGVIRWRSGGPTRGPGRPGDAADRP